MHLNKWYFDFVSDDGHAYLCYSAKLQYKGVSLGYSAVVEGQAGHLFHASYSLSAPEPQQLDQQIIWTAPKNGTRFLWQNTHAWPSPSQTLWQTSEGAVKWHNKVPSAAAQAIHQGNTLHGVGYVECLDLSILPWRLPLKRLCWGRFASLAHALVWIHWDMQDGSCQQWLFYNGMPVEASLLSEQEIVFTHGHLYIEAGSPIRQGYLRDTAFSTISFLNRFLPKQVIDIHENKRLASAQLQLKKGTPIKGWVIDETVVFP